MFTAVLAAGLLLAAAVTWQLAAAFGPRRGAGLAALLLAALAGGWFLLDLAPDAPAAPADWSAVASVPSTACARCHPDHHASWSRTYHRTMTRDATPEYVKGDFANVSYECQGVTTRLTREGDAFFVETLAPNGRQPQRFRVDRLVGSHWVQEYMHREANGRFSRLPVLFHLTENRWVHSNGAFLAPDNDDFWSQARGDAWNDTCLYCHNTGPVKNPLRGRRGEVVGYETEVAELGISCEACHGPAGEHVRLNANPARRLALRDASAGDPSIVHPERLPVPRRDEVCARCHGALVPKRRMWDPETQRDPFVAGQELTRFNHLFWSEQEQAEKAGLRRPGPKPPETDGRFWADGTPLTTALEYNGLALSACYQDGKGSLSCLSCHAMHGTDPNFMLKPGMGTNEACYQCHESYRGRLAEHTRHPADSDGSLCYNCHMPHQVYSLLTTHRSHRIETPRVQAGSGKPNACNLCHLDKSLGWTQAQLSRWPSGGKPAVKLSADEEAVSSMLLLLARHDARSRVVAAGAFSSPAAQRASGKDWLGPYLTRVLDHERYPAVRYLAHRGLRRALGEAAAGPYDYLGRPAERAAQVRALRARFAAPLARPGLPDEATMRRLLKSRTDPDLTINE